MSKPLLSVIDCLRSYFSNPHFKGLADSELLRRFVETNSADAFTCLMHRHGPMVLGLARRIVRDHQLAEDIFQATFLILSRKARTIRGRESLAAWLHSIAFRLAARAKKHRQRSEELHASIVRIRQPDPLDELTAREFLTILDEELNKLPEKYRLPLILCYLEGLTREEAAKRLGLSLPSVKARLERGRERLRLRLTKRGLGAGLVMATSWQFGQNAMAVPHALVQSTLSATLSREGATVAAVALANGAIKMMFLAKLQSVCLAVALLGVAGFGAAWWVRAGSAVNEEMLAPVPAPVVAIAGQNRQAKEKRVDLYGDALPDGAVMRLGTVQLRASGTHLALSPDGKTLIGVRGGGVLSFWDVATGKLKLTRELPNHDKYDSLLSPDGARLATGSGEVFDVESGKLLRRQDPQARDNILDKAFSPDGKYFAAIAWNEGKYRIWVWELIMAKEIFSKEIPRKKYEQSQFVSFTPDGAKLLACLAGSPAVTGTYCWDIATGALIWQNKDAVHYSNLSHAPAFSADGTMILSCDPPLDVTSGKAHPLKNMPPREPGDQIVALPDGHTLLIGNGNGVVVWDVKAGRQVRIFSGAGEEIVLARDGKTFITNNGSLQRWDLSTGKPFYPDNFDDGHRHEVTSLLFSRDGHKLVSAAADGSVRVWDVMSGRPIHVWRGHESWRPYRLLHWANAGVKALDMTPDGRWIISAGSEERFCVWDAATGEQVSTFPLPQAEMGGSEQLVYHLRIDSDGKKATGLFGAQGHTFVVGQAFAHTDWLASWDLRKGTLLTKRSLDGVSANQSALSHDGKTLLSFPKFVDLDTLKELAHCETHGAQGDMARARFAPDGALFAADCGEEKDMAIHPAGIRVWETATGKSILHMKTKSWNSQFAFHPNLRYLAVDDFAVIQIWDVITGKMVATRKMPKGHTSLAARGSYTSCLAFTPDGRRLATGHPDGTILLWNIDLPVAKPVPLAVKDIEPLWNDLKDADAAKAWRAVWRLVDSPDEVVPYLKRRLKPFAPAPEEITRHLLADLDDASFAKREAASKRLLELGFLAEPALRARLKDKPSLETQRRVEALLKTIVEAPQLLTPESLRDVRAVAVLARIHSSAARGILEELAKGVVSARLTSAADAALRR